MKKVLMSLLVVGFISGSVLAIPALDTLNPSLNAVDEGYWNPMCDNLSSIDTTGGLFKKDGVDDIVVVKCTKGAAIGDSIYPWVSVDVELDSNPVPANFVGVTAIRLTYMADKAWWLVLPDSTIDENVSGPYQALIPSATTWMTMYFNVLDTPGTFKQPSWIATGDKTPIQYQNIKTVSFSPWDESDAGVTTTIQIKDLTLFNYKALQNAVINTRKPLGHVTNGITLTRANSLRFSVPSNNTYTVSLYSAGGKLIATSRNNFSANGENLLSLKQYDLTPGMYLVSIKHDTFSAMGKFMIK